VKNKMFVIAALSAITAAAQADDLCAVNPYKKSEAQLGKAAFDSKCAFCHQYSMTGREPGNSARESPAITVLTASDVEFLDGAGGKVPPLVGAAFFNKHKDKTLADFSAYVSSAANTFPAAKMKVPDTYFQIAAYILYRNCGKM
jgi:cytochrome c